jgi:hypothetical protein
MCHLIRYCRLLVFIFFIISGCKKDSVRNNCVPKKIYLSPFAKQFEFKVGSYWVFVSSTNSNYDSMIVNLPSNNFNTLPPNNSSSSCDSYELYTIGLSHMWFLGGDYLTFSLNYDNVFIGVPQYYSFSNSLALVNANAPDSINHGSGAWVKLEARFDTLTVLGTKYNNVYQMRYFPALNKFQRIWWCPNIGFVKFEFVNLQSTIDTWQLKTSHIIL